MLHVLQMAVRSQCTCPWSSVESTRLTRETWWVGIRLPSFSRGASVRGLPQTLLSLFLFICWVFDLICLCITLPYFIRWVICLYIYWLAMRVCVRFTALTAVMWCLLFHVESDWNYGQRTFVEYKLCNCTIESHHCPTIPLPCPCHCYEKTKGCVWMDIVSAAPVVRGSSKWGCLSRLPKCIKYDGEKYSYWSIHCITERYLSWNLRLSARLKAFFGLCTPMCSRSCFSLSLFYPEAFAQKWCSFWKYCQWIYS